MSRVAYLVSRFPIATETFVVREMNGVDADPGFDLELFSLFPPKDPFVHDAARRWVPRAHHGRLGDGLAGLAWWSLRRPGRLLGALGGVIRGYGPRPQRLARALATFVVAAGHARTMRRLGIERIHAHFANWPTVTAWVCARLLDVPYSFTAHAHDVFVDQSNLDRLIADADFVATISEYNRTLLGGLAPDARTPIHVVHCGIDVDGCPYAETDPPVAGPFRLLCVGALQEKKGHAVLLDALARRRTGLDRCVLDLVGGGELEAELRARVETLGLADRVTFHGERTEAQVQEHLRQADALVLPSIRASSGQMEGLPVAVLEALAAGVPVVSTALSGLPELLREEATCLLATAGDPVSLAVALRDVVDRPGAARDRARAGRALVEREFALSQTVSRMVELLRGADRPALTLERVPLGDVDWVHLDGYADRSPFQSRAWLDFLVETQGGDPVVARVRDGDRTVGWFTGMVVRRFGVRILGSPMRGWSTGPMGFNLDPGVSRHDATEALFEFAFGPLRCLHVELMDRDLSFDDAAALDLASTTAVAYEIDLTRPEDELFAAMSRVARKAIRKAAREGVVVEQADPEGFAREYYAQLEDVFAKQGLRPPYGVERVEALVRHLAPTGDLELVRALTPDGRPAATALRIKGPAFAYSWGAASWREHQGLRPNEAAFWFAMKHIKADGIPLLDLGGGGEYKLKYGVVERNRPFVRRSRFRVIEIGRDVAARIYWRAATRGRPAGGAPS